jgi:hypothetical protein
MHFERQLGRQAAGNNVPGFPNPTGCHPADADPAEAIRFGFGSKMTTMHPRMPGFSPHTIAR